MSEHKVAITSHSEGMKSEVEAGKHTLVIDEPPQMGGTDQGADPLATMLGSLAGCETVIANMVAKEIDFDLQNISFDINGTLDMRGLMGTADVKPYFETVTSKQRLQLQSHRIGWKSYKKSLINVVQFSLPLKQQELH